MVGAARRVYCTVTGLRSPSLLFPFIVALGGQAMDGLTRFAMPDSLELNPLSVALGGSGSLLVKAVLLLYLALFTFVLRGRRDRLAGAVLWFAGIAGIFGAYTNLGSM